MRAEHPDLWHRSRKQPKEMHKRGVMRRCVVPLFPNTDSDSDSMVDIDREEVEESSSDDSSANEPRAQEEPTDRRAGVRPAESLSDSEDMGAKTKREKFDSGCVSDLLGSVSERSSSSSNQSPATDSSAKSSSDPDCTSTPITVSAPVTSKLQNSCFRNGFLYFKFTIKRLR